MDAHRDEKQVYNLERPNQIYFLEPVLPVPSVYLKTQLNGEALGFEFFLVTKK